MRFGRTLVALSLALGALLASAVPASAEPASRVRAGVERIDLGNGVTMLRGVESQAQLAASCSAGQFCGYSSVAGYGLSWGCGSASVPWSGGGWWYNNLSGNTTDRVAMFGSSGSRIYTTPHSPSQDTTANWTPVYSLLMCVA